MNIALWIIQGLLALAFLMFGGMKMSQSQEKLVGMMPWVFDFSSSTVKFIGLLEVLGAIGLVAPMLTGILPWLTPLAAVGLALTMVGGTITHLRRGENQVIILNIVLFLLAAFVAYGRFVG